MLSTTGDFVLESDRLDQSSYKTWIGNRLAFALLVLIFVALRLNKPALGGQRVKDEMVGRVADATSVGSRRVFLSKLHVRQPHQKRFAFVSSHMDTSSIERRCSKDHQHVRLRETISNL